MTRCLDCDYHNSCEFEADFETGMQKEENMCVFYEDEDLKK